MAVRVYGAVLSAPGRRLCAELSQGCRGNGSRPFIVVSLDGQDSDVYDPLVRLLRPRQDAARLEAARLRGDPPRRRPGLPAAAPRSDRGLDGPADPHRRAADRRLHRALAARPRRPARRAARRLTTALSRLAGRAEPRPAPAGARLRDRRAAAVARLALPPVDLELVLHAAARAVR